MNSQGNPKGAGARAKRKKRATKPRELFENAIVYEIGSLAILGAHEASGTVAWAPKQAVSVLQALALELCLKCLVLMDRGEFPWTHLYTDLYALLKPATRREIRRDYEAALDKSGWRYIVPCLRPGGLGLPASSLKFANLLRTHSNAFVRWRYSHEWPKGRALMWLAGPLLLAPIRRLIVRRDESLKPIVGYLK